MTNNEAIGILAIVVETAKGRCFVTDEAISDAYAMAISALQEQEVKQEVKKSGCTYKPDCPWYDGSKCNSPNDHGYHECDYDRGIFPESYEELSKNSPKLDSGNGELISRQDALSFLRNWERVKDYNWGERNIIKATINEIESLPSAQPDTKAQLPGEGTTSDCISRQAAIDALMSLTVYKYKREIVQAADKHENSWIGGVAECIDEIEDLPSAQPELNFDEWCTDCKEYDHEKHCCPRFNRVIRNALKDAQPEPQWIPVSERLPEKKIGRYWVCLETGGQCQCRWTNDMYGLGANEWSDWGWHIMDKPQYSKIIAWMPLPEPYQEESV